MALIREHLASGRRPSSACVPLPAEKSGVPKLVCLDMKDWVALGRAHYRLHTEPGVTNALQVLEKAIDASRIVVPLTSANLLEVSGVASGERRMRLAEFMIHLSRNQSLIDHVATREREIFDALRLEYLGRPPSAHDPVRTRLLRWGVGAAAGAERVVVDGLSPAVQEHLREVLNLPFVSARALGGLSSAENRAATRGMDEAWQTAEEEVRRGTAHLNSAERWQLEGRFVLLEGEGRAQLQALAPLLGIAWSQLERWLEVPEHRIAIMKAIPSASIALRLRLSREKNPQQRTHRNDLKDLVFLSSTLPYANVIVTEKAWGQFVSRERLDVEYGTKICRSVSELPIILEDLGLL